MEIIWISDQFNDDGHRLQELVSIRELVLDLQLCYSIWLSCWTNFAGLLRGERAILLRECILFREGVRLPRWKRDSVYHLPRGNSENKIRFFIFTKFFLTKFHFLPFQKWPKANVRTGKVSKLPNMQFHEKNSNCFHQAINNDERLAIYMYLVRNQISR